MYNYGRRIWPVIDTRTITLKIYTNGWTSFVIESGIENIPSYEKVFTTLLSLYGNLFTKPNTVELLSNRLRFYIENEVEKQNKQDTIWDTQIERLMGDYNEINHYDIGELKPDDLVDANFDKYLIARQTNLAQVDILEKIQTIQKMKTPFESVIGIIKEKLFIPHQKSLDEIVLIEGENNE